MENSRAAGGGRREAVGLAAGLIAMTAFTVYAFASKSWLPPVASEHGPGVDGMIRYLLYATGAIFVGGHVVLVLFLLRYSRPDAAVGPLLPRREWVWSIGPVIGMTLIAEGGVMVIGMPTWNKVYGGAPPDAVQVEAVGKQFEWTFRYPGKDGRYGRIDPKQFHKTENPLALDENDPAAADDVVVRGTLRLPVGKTVSLQIRSMDVLHSFTVPQFRVKQDAVPGLVTGVRFRPEAAGEYEVACAELCGFGHYTMRGRCLALPAAEFEAWLKQQTGWFE